MKQIHLALMMVASILAMQAEATLYTAPAGAVGGWWNSGTSIAAGTYTVTASGQWDLGGGTFTTASGNNHLWGGQYNWDVFYAGAAKGGLVFYVGSTPPYPVSNGGVASGTAGYYSIQNGIQTITFTGGGLLWMVCNDGGAVGGNFNDNSGSLQVDINAVPVPETSTLVAGVLMLLPFGMSTIRIVHKKVMA